MERLTSDLTTISWEKTWQAIRSLLPNAEYCTPASLTLAAEKVNIPVVLLNPDDFPQHGSDPLLLRKLLGRSKLDESIIVVTDCCFREGWTPFLLRLAEVEMFATEYRRLTDECVISGSDVVLISPESKYLVLLHHEGAIATVGR